MKFRGRAVGDGEGLRRTAQDGPREGGDLCSREAVASLFVPVTAISWQCLCSGNRLQCLTVLEWSPGLLLGSMEGL